MTDRLDQDRERIHRLLADGLETDWRNRAYTHAEIQRCVQALQALAPDDLAGKLRVGGFTLTPYIAAEAPELRQDCSTCMYYVPNRRFCALPELRLGVEAQWSCILWRI